MLKDHCADIVIIARYYYVIVTMKSIINKCIDDSCLCGVTGRTFMITQSVGPGVLGSIPAQNHKFSQYSN